MAFSIEQYHGGYNIVARSSTPLYIVMHYTGSGSPTPGVALANCKYFAGGNRNASAHYFIDNAHIYEYADPAKYTTWHCGDGHGKYGITNSNSIGIEVCQNGNTAYTEPEIERATWLVQKLMSQFGIPASRVVRHYDASRKACPYYYTPYGAGGNSAWTALRARLTSGSTAGDSTTLTGEFGQNGENMECIIQPDGANVLVYFDGHDFHDLTHPDDVKALNMVYQKTHNGASIPQFAMGSKTAPWAARLAQAVHAGEPSEKLWPSINQFKPRSPKSE